MSTDAEHFEQYVADGMVASEARLAAADALRRLGHAIVSHDPGDGFFGRGVELTYRGRLTRREGRKLWIEGECTSPEGTRVAEASGLFVAIDFSKLGETKEVS